MLQFPTKLKAGNAFSVDQFFCASTGRQKEEAVTGQIFQSQSQVNYQQLSDVVRL